MINFMRDGGFTMWLLVLAAVLFAGLALSKPAARRTILATGAVSSLALGMLGLSLGMAAVAEHFHRFPDHNAAIVGVGLGELSNNGVLAVMLAAMQGFAALVSPPPAAQPS